MKIRLIICFAAMWLFTLFNASNVAYAITVPDLYLATVTVPTQSDEAREAAVQTGFQQVLIRLSGDEHIGNNPFIQENINRADYYVQEFSYSAATTASSEYTLQIRYDQTDVNRLLKRANRASLGSDRPLILVWLALTDVGNNTTNLVGNDSESPIVSMVLNDSNKYGLPMILPLLDVTDLNQVSFNDVAALNLSTLSSAAKRYAPDGMLIGKLQASERGVDSQWVLLLHGQRWNWTLSTNPNVYAINKIIDASLNQLSQVLVAKQAQHTLNEPSNWLKLQVSSLADSQDMLHLLTYLRQLDNVKRVQINHVTMNTALLDVQIKTSRASFQHKVAAGQYLAEATTTTADHTLNYIWVH